MRCIDGHAEQPGRIARWSVRGAPVRASIKGSDPGRGLQQHLSTARPRCTPVGYRCIGCLTFDRDLERLAAASQTYRRTRRRTANLPERTKNLPNRIGCRMLRPAICRPDHSLHGKPTGMHREIRCVRGLPHRKPTDDGTASQVRPRKSLLRGPRSAI